LHLTMRIVMDNYKIKLKIGEFSKLCYVTVKTLRYYEKIGLLMPHEVDKWTGYRYYEVSQMKELNDIVRLKHLGLSLEEIRDMKEEGDGMMSPEAIDKALAAAESDLATVRKRITELKALRGFSTNQNFMENITIKPLPGGEVASFRKRIDSYDELGPLCCDVIGPEMHRLGCECPQETAYCFSVDHNRNYNPSDIDVEYCEIVSRHDGESDILKFKKIPVVEKAVCFSHRGNYRTFGESMAVLARYIEDHHLQIADDPRFCYIHGVWDSETEDDWLTEIQWPVSE